MTRSPPPAGATVAEPDAKGSLWWLAAAVAVLRRPSLWAAALSQAMALVPRKWWRRPPRRPTPAPRWIAFRMETAYGHERARPAPEDVTTFLEWCRESRRRVHRVH